MNKFCPYCGQPTNTGGMCSNWQCNSYSTQESTITENGAISQKNKIDERLCPFQARHKDGTIDVFCVKEKCMAWGTWTRHGAYRDEIEITGCYLIKSGE